MPVNQLIDYEEIGEEKGEKGEIIKHNLSVPNIICTFTMADAAALRAMLLRCRMAERTAVYSARICMLRLRTYPIIISVSSFMMRCAGYLHQFNFENQNNRSEMLAYAINSFNNGGRMEGLCCCLSTQPILPACFKFLMVSGILEETDDLKKSSRSFHKRRISAF